MARRGRKPTWVGSQLDGGVLTEFVNRYDSIVADELEIAKSLVRDLKLEFMTRKLPVDAVLLALKIHQKSDDPVAKDEFVGQVNWALDELAKLDRKQQLSLEQGTSAKVRLPSGNLTAVA